MKVKCIRNEGQPWTGSTKKKFFWSSGIFKRNGPSFGDVVSVSKEYWEEGKKWYELVEWPNGVGYLSTHFTPIEEEEEPFEEGTFTKSKKKNPISAN